MGLNGIFPTSQDHWVGLHAFGGTEHPWCSRQSLSPGEGQKRRLLLLWSAPAILGGSFSLSPKTVLFLPSSGKRISWPCLQKMNPCTCLSFLPGNDPFSLACGCTPGSPSRHAAGAGHCPLRVFNPQGPGRGLRMEKMLQTSQTGVNCSKMLPL